MFSRIRRFMTLAALCGFSQLASAAWPENTITLIVPWAAGGSTDILARALAEQLTKSLGQPVIVDNRAGASGNIGSHFVAKAKPDGYTLLIGSMSTHAMNPALMPNMPFRGVEDFTPIAQMANVVNTLVINPSVPAKNVKELIAYAKANPGKLAYASAGAGSTNHLSAVLFDRRQCPGHRRQPDPCAVLRWHPDPAARQVGQAAPAGRDRGEAFRPAARRSHRWRDTAWL